MGMFLDKAREKQKSPTSTLKRLQTEADNRVTRLEAEGAKVPPLPSERKSPWDIAIDVLTRPQNAYFTGAKRYTEAVNRGDLPKPNQFTPFGGLSSALFSKPFWSGVKEGITGKERTSGADLITADFPEFAQKNPRATQILGAGTEILGDPLNIVGSAAPKLLGNVISKGALAAVSATPDVALAAERILPFMRNAPGIAQGATKVESGLRNLGRIFQRGSGNPAFAEDLRQFRARKDDLRQGVIDEVKGIIDPLTPEQQRTVRRVLDAPGGVVPPDALAAVTQPKARKFSLKSGELTSPDTIKRVGLQRPTPSQYDPAVAGAVQQVKERITDWVPEQYAAYGIPMNTIDEGYFPRVRSPETTLETLKNTFRRRTVKTSDPFTQARKLERELPIEEVNQKLGRQLFREDLGVPLATRKVAAMENIEGRKFLKQVFDTYGMDAETLVKKAAEEGRDVSAAKGRVLAPLPEGYAWVSPDTGAIVKPYDAAKVGAVALPGDIAKTIDGLSAASRNPDETMRAIEETAQKLRRFWSASVTIYRPGFHFNNWVGGVVNNVLGGVKDPRRYSQSYAILEGKAGTLVTEAGERIPYEDIRRALRRTGTLNSGFAGSLEESFISQTEQALGQSATLKNPLKFADQKARQAGRAVENHLRSTLFIDRVAKGESFDQAAKSVIDFHFDYSPEGLDPVGRKLKPWVPFYVWLRNNLQLQAEQFVKQPMTYVNYERIRDGLAGDTEGRPEYLEDAIPLGSVGGQDIYWNLRTPIEDVKELVEDPGRLFSSLDPRLKVPLDVRYNQNSFTGAPISRFEGDKEPMLGADVPAGLAYSLRGLSGIFGTAEQVASESIEDGFGPRQGAKVISQFIPGVSAVDPSKQEVNELYARNKQLSDALRALAQKLGRPVVTIPELRESGRIPGGKRKGIFKSK